MIRRLAALVAAAAIVVTGCNSTSAPALTDPKDILSQSVAALQGLKSVHMHLDVTGTLNIDITGSGTPSAIDLGGTTADVDVDIPNKKIRLTAAAPALLGLSMDFIQVGNDQYTKISLQGPKYTKAAASPGASSAPTDPTKIISDMKAGLDKLTNPPVKGADEKVGDQDCYKVSLNLTSADLSGAGASLPPDITASATLDVWVRKNDLRPAKLAATVDAGAQGKVTVTVTLSNYDGAVTIDAPPSDQVSNP